MSKESPIVKLSDLISNELWNSRDHILGEILTIIDASISDAQQRKGLKDLIKKTGYNHENFKWTMYRIRKMLLEFNQKFAKTIMTDKEIEYFDTGEYEKDTISTNSTKLPDYFGENN